MNNQTEIMQDRSKERRLKYAIAFAFGLGVGLGGVISSRITAILKP